ncbi:hypothetical protein GCM10027275_41760 [Rhabdobacter roseus]|uniref:Mutator family transposase n=1 Tax=Rhabdobacter roseus TaxID=1655419 RepID=A0A840TXZ2_9BACT|nr:hypothetical protein [Rhabdobacter roseus]MBB5286153.1 hypothetical protein [Rhabdobacter roseus]
METDKNFDFEKFKKEAMQGLSEGKKQGGADGVFRPMIKYLLESMLEGELTNHLEESKASGVANRRNAGYPVAQDQKDGKELGRPSHGLTMSQLYIKFRNRIQPDREPFIGR